MDRPLAGLLMVEAFSPQTLDTSILYFAGYGAMYGITRIT
jgi:hypothetical protein